MKHCCTQAVFDYTAGWWCPAHGDQMELESASDDDLDWRERPELLRLDSPADPF